MRVLRVFASEMDYEFVDLELKGSIKFALDEMEKTRAYRRVVMDPKIPFIFSTGPLSATSLPGTHRLTFVFRSPLTGSFYVSSLGGAGYSLKATEIDAVTVVGKAENPIAILVNKDGVKVLEVDVVRAYKLWKEKGISALIELLKPTSRLFRVIASPPGAFKTPFATVKSLEIVNGRIKSGTEDFAGRAGAGSVLLQAHGVLGFIFEPYLKNFHERAAEAVKIVKEALGPAYINKIMEAGSKYLQKGTFGGNYEKLSPITPCRNFRNVYGQSCEDQMLSDRWLQRFQEEVLKTRSMTTCGEPCPLRCKKVYGDIKIDYEPMNAFGPYIGLFDFDLAARLVKLNDFLGFDAIELGHIVAWVLEALEKKLLDPKAVDGLYLPNQNERDLFEFAEKMLRGIAFQEEEIFTILRQGRRVGARLLEEILGTDLKEIAVYIPFGQAGYIAPTMYWALGNFMPVPLQGRYWTYYKPGIWLEPGELASKSFSRALSEIAYDDLGLCRFHRGWFEVVKERLEDLLNYVTPEKEILRRIILLNRKANALPKTAETARVFDIVANAALKFGASEEWKKLAKTPEELYLRYVEEFEQEYNRLVMEKD